MDKVRKPNISVRYTPSSEPYSIYFKDPVGNSVYYSVEHTIFSLVSLNSINRSALLMSTPRYLPRMIWIVIHYLELISCFKGLSDSFYCIFTSLGLIEALPSYISNLIKPCSARNSFHIKESHSEFHDRIFSSKFRTNNRKLDDFFSSSLLPFGSFPPLLEHRADFSVS
jgi:hypothetical protein